MKQGQIVRLNINWGIVGVILIGIYLGIGWFARGYVDGYNTKQAALQQAEVQIGIGGGPPQKKTYEIGEEGQDDVVDMLCLPMDDGSGKKKVIHEI